MTAPLIETVDPRQVGLGRLYAPDPRDARHPIENALRAMSRGELKRRTQAPARAGTLDQHDTSECTEYGLAHCMGASPVRWGATALDELNVPLDGHRDCYTWSQHNDEWEGAEPEYYGTSVRAALSYALKRRLIREYVWARSIEEAKDYISRVGSAPIEAGFDWWSGMSDPRLYKGVWVAEPNGYLQGGHAFCVLWFDKRKGMWKCQNSWGTTYGDDGVFYIPDDAFQYLAFQANGELASFIEAAP